MQKNSSLLLVALLISSSVWAEPRMLWSYEKKDGFDAPESVYFDQGTDSFYVSNVAGEVTAKDGKGWISKISRDGKKLQSKWVDGLNAPKGIRIHGETLWVADIDELVGISLKTAKITERYTAPGAKFLNDVATSKEGEVFVSDTSGEKIYVLKNKKIEVFMEGSKLEAPNGLLVEGDTLFVVGWGQGIKADWSVTTPGKLYSVDLKTKKMKFITRAPLGNLDGLERNPSGGFFITDWVAGKVFEVGNSGKSKIILQNIKGSADLGIDSVNKVIVVPGMKEDRISAYVFK